MPNETKCYKIRDKRKPGLWKCPGYYGSFNPRGKTWSALGDVSNAINISLNRRDEGQLDNWEIVEFTIQESSSKTVREYLEERKKKNGKTTKPR